MITGTVKFFNASKGYGFIRPDEGGQPDAFFHATSLVDPRREPVGDERVSFEVGTDPKNGRDRAEKVRIL